MVNSFLADFTLVLGVAALTSAITHHFRIPLILGYLVAGLIIGPYVPIIPLFADHKQVETISELGIIFVMFCVGLEFRFRNLAKIIPKSGPMAITQITLLMACGHGLGRLLGWSHLESLFLGASISISSTMVVSKIYNSSTENSGAKEGIFGILILQDIFAIVLIAALTALADGVGLSFQELGGVAGRLISVIILLLGGGILIIPRFIRFVIQFKNNETLIVLSCALCCCMALTAEFFGYSVALGAFVAGVLVAESGFGHRIEELMSPLRDLFSAIFFVSIGMTVDPVLAIKYLPISILIALLVIFGQFIALFVTGMMTGSGIKKSVITGLALGQIGEFAFIISSVGLKGDIFKVAIQPILVTVAVITSFTSPFLFQKSEAIISIIDRLIPNRIRILFSFYESLLEKFQIKYMGNRCDEDRPLFIRFISILSIDLIVLLFLIFLVGPNLKKLTPYLSFLPFSSGIRSFILPLLLLLSMIPFLMQFILNLIQLENFIIKTTFGRESQSLINEEKFHSSARLLKTLINSFIFFLAGVPVLTLFSTFVENYLLISGYLFWGLATYLFIWKKAGVFEQEMISGTKLYLKYLERKLLKTPHPKNIQATHIPGMREITHVEIKEGAPAAGKSLCDLDLRAQTGATVMAIMKENEQITHPKGNVCLEVKDILSLVGTKQAITLAKELLTGE